MRLGLKKQALACCAVLLCTGWVLADGSSDRFMRAAVVDNQGELLTQATVVAHTAGVSEPIRGEPAGDGTWLLPGLGEKTTLVVKDPVRGTASVELSLPEGSGGAVVQIYWGEKGAEARIVATIPELTSKGFQSTPSIAPSPFGMPGSRADTCPGDSLFGQAPHQPDASWSFATCGDTTSFTYRVYEDFWGVSGDINDIHWWGLSLHFDPVSGWAACDPTGMTFDIVFYADAGGAPGAVECTYAGVTPTYSGTGLFYAGFEMLYFELDLATSCSLSEGWVSIQSQANANDCTLLWASSPDGNGDSLQEDVGGGTPPASTLYDRGLCLTGVYVPTYGACCDDSTGTCTDDVEMQDCPPPLRFSANALCADLDPACGDITTCEHSIVLTDDYGDGWNGGSVTVRVNTVSVLTVTLASGAGPETYFFQAGTGDTIDTVYVAGSWAYENEYHVYDVNGFQICASGVGGTQPTGGFCGYGNCGADPCEGNEPANDECVDATPVAGPYPQTVSGTNYCATVDCPGVLDWNATWWAIDLPDAVNNLTVSFCGNGFEINNVGVVYYNACGDCPNYVLYNGIDWYSCPDGITSPVINWDDIPGPTTVYFPVYFNNGAMEAYTIEIDVVGVVVPDNDLCGNAIAVDVPSTTSGTTAGATVDSDAPFCGTSITSAGVWYSVMGTGNTMTASLCGGATWDTKMSVYCVDCAELLCVDGNDDACGVQSEVTWCSQYLAEYFILVHGYGSASGPFDLNIFDDGAACSGGVACLPEGACCLPTGECVVTTEFGCDAAGGDYHGDDTTCGVGTIGDESNARLDCSDSIIDALTTASPTWNRIYGAYTPDLSCNAVVYLSSAGQYYAAYPIGVGAVENLDIEVLSAGFSDSVMTLYCDPFDPANPMDNVVAYDDDDGAGMWSAFLPSDGIQLNVGATYYLVLSTFSAGYTGDFEICLRGTAYVGGGGPGACCFPDGTCADMEAADCNAAGGMFGGSGTECATYVCPEYPGACCLPDGSCIVTIESCCDYAGGMFVGQGTDCGTGTVVFFSEDFDAGIPGDWTITDDDGSGLMWNTNVYWGDGNYTGGSGDCADASSDAFGSASYDTSLITPALDLSAAVSATLDFECDFQNFAYYDWFYVDVSYDNGATWNNLLTWNEDHTAEHVTLPFAAGSAETLIRFRYYDPVSHWNWQVQIDDVVVTAEVEGLSPCQYLDIKPGSCPNPFNRRSHGVMHTALVGTADFDVHMVDLSTLLLARQDGVGGSLAPHEGPPGPWTKLRDTATPFFGGPWDCHEYESDGILDVSMWFKSDDVTDVFELDGEAPGAHIALVLSGYLTDGSPFVARDHIWIVPPNSPPGQLVITSNIMDAWLDVTPLDQTVDGGGWTNFERTYPVGTVVTLTAPDRFDGRPFYAWKVDGVVQTRGERSIEITVVEGVQTLAFDAVFAHFHDSIGATPAGQDKKTPQGVQLP